MADRLFIIIGFGLFLTVVYALCMRSTPRRGYMRVIERMCAGIILCYLCGLLLRPFGIELSQSPLSALAAGYLGLPGAALGAFLTIWP